MDFYSSELSVSILNSLTKPCAFSRKIVMMIRGKIVLLLVDNHFEFNLLILQPPWAYCETFADILGAKIRKDRGKTIIVLGSNHSENGCVFGGQPGRSP